MLLLASRIACFAALALKHVAGNFLEDVTSTKDGMEGGIDRSLEVRQRDDDAEDEVSQVECKNNMLYRSPQGLSCDSYRMMSCRNFGRLGFSELDVNGLLSNCPKSCNVECDQRRMTTEMATVMYDLDRRRVGEDSESFCNDKDDKSYFSPQGAPCSAYQDWDCRLFAIVGFTEFQLYELINACPASCKTPCGTFTLSPSVAPTGNPTESSEPSVSPTQKPSNQPSTSPSMMPSSSPSHVPTTAPSDVPSDKPSSQPSITPSSTPTTQPSASPSATPTASPSDVPSASPSRSPSDVPSLQPTNIIDGLNSQLFSIQEQAGQLIMRFQELTEANRVLQEKKQALIEANDILTQEWETLEGAERLHRFMQGFLFDTFQKCEARRLTVERECTQTLAFKGALLDDLSDRYNTLLGETMAAIGPQFNTSTIDATTPFMPFANPTTSVPTASPSNVMGYGD